jgi:hypothetical protein
MLFESSIFMSEQLTRMMVSVGQELAVRAVAACAHKYDFDCDEALRMLDLVNVRVIHSKRIESKKKESVVKSVFPMPFNGELNEKCCYALRQNNGLYTQCQSVKKNGDYCKQCQVLADKSEGIPEYGTIQQRIAVGVFEYVDPKGRKPVAYTKVMKKYKVSQEEVLLEAERLNINIIGEHFEVAEADIKRGRPALPDGKKKEKEPKGAKGRPKKMKKVLQVDGDDDLFATLVADANSEEEIVAPNKRGKKSVDEENESKKAEEEETKKANEEQIKKEKEALAQQKLALAQEKLAEKEALAQQKLALAQEKLALAQQKLAEKEALAQQKLALAQQKLAEKEANQTKKNKTKKDVVVAAAAPTTEEEAEPDVVKKIEFEGKKYLKSKKTGIIYDYAEYTKNGEQIVVGKWNDAKNNVEFSNTEEETEDDYDDA